ncbi:50S ribosomal protein L25 [Candidatus Saccharibacteria bacterium]|jgi:large subunit ribosomal protein L25|nr:50S ribosomal protein L25 [Candidatus Saccharibacteria bacterium]
MANEKITLSVTKREVTGKKVKELRVKGLVPGVIYGAKIEPVLVQTELLPLIKVIKAAGTHTPIEINVEGGDKHTAIIKEVVRAVTKTTPIHIEFQAVSADQIVRTEVPIRVIDEEESQAKKLGLLFMQSLEEIEVKAKPADLPEFLAVSAKELAKHDDKLLVSNIAVPEGVEILIEDIDTPVLTVADPSVLAAKSEAEDQKDEAETAEVAANDAEATAPAETEKTE